MNDWLRDAINGGPTVTSFGAAVCYLLIAVVGIAFVIVSVYKMAGAG